VVEERVSLEWKAVVSLGQRKSKNSQGTDGVKMMTSRGRTLGGKCLTSEMRVHRVQDLGEESWPLSDRMKGVRRR